MPVRNSCVPCLARVHSLRVTLLNFGAPTGARQAELIHGENDTNDATPEKDGKDHLAPIRIGSQLPIPHVLRVW